MGAEGAAGSRGCKQQGRPGEEWGDWHVGRVAVGRSSARCCWSWGEAGSWRGTSLSCWKCTAGRQGEGAGGQRALGTAGQGLHGVCRSTPGWDGAGPRGGTADRALGEGALGGASWSRAWTPEPWPGLGAVTAPGGRGLAAHSPGSGRGPASSPSEMSTAAPAPDLGVWHQARQHSAPARTRAWRLPTAPGTGPPPPAGSWLGGQEECVGSGCAQGPRVADTTGHRREKPPQRLCPVTPGEDPEATKAPQAGVMLPPTQMGTKLGAPCGSRTQGQRQLGTGTASTSRPLLSK